MDKDDKDEKIVEEYGRVGKEIMDILNENKNTNKEDHK